jgi:hypothetical protein
MVDPNDLIEVRIGACGCVLRADLPPVGFRFVKSAVGDVRQPVFACERHYYPGSEPVASAPAVHKPKRKRRAAAGV